MSSKNTFFCLFTYSRANLFALIDILIITLICVWIEYKFRRLTIKKMGLMQPTFEKCVAIPWIHPVIISAVLTEIVLGLSADVYTFL